MIRFLLAILLCLTSTTHAATVCSWDHPGRDPYTGTSADAINRMPIPADARARLIARATRKHPDYEDVVYVDRESIKGKHSYAPEIGSMNFGNKGKVCDRVTRDKWTADHLESGIVFCDGPYCVVRFSVCNNWSMIWRQEKVQPGPDSARPNFFSVFGDEPFDFMDYGQFAAPTPASSSFIEPGEIGPPGYVYTGFGGGFAYFGGGGGGGCFCCDIDTPFVPVSPVPEPSTWAMLVIGLAVVIFRRKLS